VKEVDGLSRPLPGEELRWRVTGERDPVDFDTTGRESVTDLTRALGLVGARLTDFKSVLDFGCGCGRIMRWLDDLPPTVKLHGVDTDPEAIAWAAANIPFARFSVNQGLPPLDFPDGYFDLVFNHSLFSHMPEDYQDAWLAELNRITHPEGFLLLTVESEFSFAGFLKSYRANGGTHPVPEEYERLYRERGIVYVEDDGWVGGPFPAYYHTTFHAPWYIFEHWGRYLTLKAYIARGALDFQSLLLLRPKEPWPLSEVTSAPEVMATPHPLAPTSRGLRPLVRGALGWLKRKALKA
jgi:SAM-dependent methyltransferase